MVASFLAQVSYGGKPNIYVDKAGELFELECPACPTLVFGDRLSLQYQNLVQCRTSHAGVVASFTKIGSDPNAGEKLIHHMDGVIAATFANGFRFEPSESDPMVSEWIVHVAEQALMQSVHPGEKIRIKYFVSGCSGAVLSCLGVALGKNHPLLPFKNVHHRPRRHHRP